MFFQQHLAPARVMVILRGYSPEDTVALCQRAYDSGVRLVEVPVQDAAAYPALDAAVAWGARVGIPVGAGTVTSVAVHDRAVAAGAAFTVAPGIDLAVIAKARRVNVPHLPGVATATDIQLAMAHGCAWLKAFPASVLGPEWIAAMLGPFPTVRFVVTGGVTVASAPRFLDAGAAAVSLGGAFADATPAALRALTQR